MFPRNVTRIGAGGSGGKKKKSNINAPFGSGLDSCSTSLVDVTGTIHAGTSLNVRNGNVNDGTIPSIFVDSGNAVKEKVNLFTPRGNEIDVVVPVESIRAISEQFVNTAYSFFLGKRVAYPIVANYVRNTWGLNSMLENGSWFIRNNPLILRKWHPDVNLLKEDVGTVLVWVKLNGVPVTAFSEDGLSAIATKLADVELKDNIVEAMPKITREGYYTCNIRVEYEWKPPRCAYCKVFRHVQEECLKNIGTGAIKNLKKASQTPKGIPVGQKIGFKPKQVFQLVSKKSTTNTCGKKMNNLKSTKEVSKSNPFEVLTSVDNDVDLEGRDSYPDNYDYDLYDDDMYENHDMSEHLQSICDDLDITVKKHASLFEKFPIENIPRNQYQKADVLSKLTSIAFNHLTKEVLVEVMNAKSVDAQEISTIVEEEEDNGMTPIIKCLEEVWLADENEAKPSG
ncbi:retrotransposon protein, putative, ty1-copia subclass [Tanacetum coccineum]|uniref:Retrotransposon protein, putative, ty1-copia subclass n=1 Tax=Tanacetum coccineum TaxID=301880 RepID=A0ABQ5CRZ6_9ASTR